MLSLKMPLISMLACLMVATGTVQVRADFIGGNVSAFAGPDERDGTEDSDNDSGLRPSANASYAYDYPDSPFSVSARSAASITVGEGVAIHVSSDATESGDSGGIGARAIGQAVWHERFDFSANILEPDDDIPLVIQANATLGINGFTSQDGTGVGTISILVLANGTDTIYSLTSQASLNQEVELIFNAARIPFPSPFYVGRLAIFVEALSFVGQPGDSSHVNFSNTVTLNNVFFTDLEGNVLDGTLTTGTGVNYNAPAAVPEPGSLALLISGGLSWLGLSRRQSRRV